MAVKIREFDAARYLRTDAARAALLNEAFATGDRALVADALGAVARAKGISAVAKQTKLSREGLYKALGREGNPRIDTLLKVFDALGLRLVAAPAVGKKPRTTLPAKKRKAA